MHADHADRDGETLLVRQRLRTIEVAHVHRVSLLDLFLLDGVRDGLVHGGAQFRPCGEPVIVIPDVLGEGNGDKILFQTGHRSGSVVFSVD